MSPDQYPDALPVTTTGGWARPGLPHAKRTYRWLSPALPDANVHGFSLEFGARETAEIDLAGKWDRERILSAGLIDIKYPTQRHWRILSNASAPACNTATRAAGDLHLLRPALPDN